MSGSKVLEGFGRMLVLAVGPNSQQGMIQQLVMNGATTASATPPLALDSSSSEGHAGHPGSDLPMLREATPLTSRLEDLANAIGGVGLAAAAAVLAVNAGLYTAELVSEGASLLTADSLEVSGNSSSGSNIVQGSSGHVAGCWHCRNSQQAAPGSRDDSR